MDSMQMNILTSISVVSTGRELANKISLSNMNYLARRYDSEFSWGFDIDKNEVRKEIELLDTSKSSGISELSMKERLLKPFS